MTSCRLIETLSTGIFDMTSTERVSATKTQEQEVEDIEERARTFARFRYLKLLILVMFVEFDFVLVKLLGMSKT